ncbi:MAG: sensor domain-containing diguanylate cyclase [Thermodesulfobacteriota bacterium]|nr:sensor domain-containing diguanylate cyclase [Thermodesulfobacteriota bacterium]
MIDGKSDKNECLYETDALLACVEIGKALTSTLDLKQILELIMVKVSRLIDAQNWSLLLKNETTGELTFDIVVGLNRDLIKGVRLEPGEGVSGQVVRTGIPLFLPNVKDDPRFSNKVDKMTGFKTRSIICVPCKIHGKIVGVIEIVNVKNMALFETKYLPFLTILTDYAAIAIENSRLFSKIQRMNVTDEYTGLYNARYLHQIIGELIENSIPQQTEFAVVFVDIDNFKTVVDFHGHLLGTKMLKEVGQTITDCLPEKGILVKYGGDEYVIILPGSDKQEAKKQTEKILSSIRETSYLQSESRPVRVTASFGIAMYPGDADTIKDLLILADKTMYRVKNTTKDAVATL